MMDRTKSWFFFLTIPFQYFLVQTTKESGFHYFNDFIIVSKDGQLTDFYFRPSCVQKSRNPEEFFFLCCLKSKMWVPIETDDWASPGTQWSLSVSSPVHCCCAFVNKVPFDSKLRGRPRQIWTLFFKLPSRVLFSGF